MGGELFLYIWSSVTSLYFIFVWYTSGLCGCSWLLIINCEKNQNITSQCGCEEDHKMVLTRRIKSEDRRRRVKETQDVLNDTVNLSDALCTFIHFPNDKGLKHCIVKSYVVWVSFHSSLTVDRFKNKKQQHKLASSCFFNGDENLTKSIFSLYSPRCCYYWLKARQFWGSFIFIFFIFLFLQVELPYFGGHSSWKQDPAGDVTVKAETPCLLQAFVSCTGAFIDWKLWIPTQKYRPQTCAGLQGKVEKCF